jgi:uncharacterized protein YecE (DUF72 family)
LGRYCGSCRRRWVMTPTASRGSSSCCRARPALLRSWRPSTTKLDGRAFAATDADRPLRHALQVRHASFENVEFVQLLRDNDIALACADTAGRWPVLGDVTSEFVYARLHGDRELYVGGYGDTALDLWAARIRTWQMGGTAAVGRRLGPPAPVCEREVFVYFDNDALVHAPFYAIALARRLGVPDLARPS